MEELTKVKSLIETKLGEIGYELYSLKYISKTKTLEIVVDRV